MPFERYVTYNRDHPPPHQNPPPQPSSSTYHSYPAPSRDDSYNFDHSIFSQNVPFQMPQLIMGPTLAPGGGAEVLPAGIVNHPSALYPSWLSTQSSIRRTCSTSDEDCSRWLPPQQSSSALFHALDEQATYCSSQQSGSSRSPSTEASSISKSSLTDPAANRRPHLSSQFHASPIRYSAASASSIPISAPFALPPVGGLPVYSSSGFNIVSLLSRVVTRPNPKVVLGPVDLTCSFLVVDVRRFDQPIVYASPTFSKLTGYSEEEVIGRNCRFLQAPDGQVQRGEPRQHTGHDAVALLRKSLNADKECQVSLVNYKKDGSAFMNLVSVIPIPGGVSNSPDEPEDVVYQIGFQVDLTEQSAAILQRLKNGTYNHSNDVAYPSPTTSKDWRVNSISNIAVSKHFRSVMNNPDFAASIPISAATTTLSLTQEERSDPCDGNRYLSLLLLETSPDFVMALSLKGAFLYVSPSVHRVLGYEPEDLVGKSITDFCIETDKVPLIRELKESSSAGPSPGPGLGLGSQMKEEDKLPLQSSLGPRGVDLLFRMQAKDGRYVWVECSGRLFSEPGKGRKAIILSGRVRNVPCLKWQSLARAGGLAQPDAFSVHHPGEDHEERECWALLSFGGSFLHASTAVRDILGWGVAEVIGRSIADFIGGPLDSGAIVRETLEQAFTDPSLESRSLSCNLKKKDGSEASADIIFYHPPHSSSTFDYGSGSVPLRTTMSTRPLVCQIRLSDGSTQPPTHSATVHPYAEDVFSQLDTARGSGWQYELQQLKHTNQRLQKEVESIEERVEERRAQHQTEESYRHQLNYSHPSGNPWAEHIMSHPVPPSLKRS